MQGRLVSKSVLNNSLSHACLLSCVIDYIFFLEVLTPEELTNQYHQRNTMRQVKKTTLEYNNKKEKGRKVHIGVNVADRPEFKN